MFWGILVPAFADGDGCAPNMVEYRYEVRLRYSTLGVLEEAYRFNVPAESCEEIRLPPRLDGFELVDLQIPVVGGRLQRLSQWSEGQPLVVSRSRKLSGGPFSEEVPASLFPVARTVVTIEAPTSTRLSVWADPSADVTVRRTRVRSYSASFAGTGTVVWSTERDWWTTGTALGRFVDGKTSRTVSIGAMAEGLSATSFGDAVQKVNAAIAIEPAKLDLDSVRSLTEVVASGSGTPAERALLLVRVLREAGYSAELALVRPTGAAPVSFGVPGRGLFHRVAVRGTDETGRVAWVDPASIYHEVGALPLALRDTVVLVPGDVPKRVHDVLAPDGVVRVRARVEVDGDGTLEVQGSVEAEGGGLQALRDVLGPLPQGVPDQWLSDLVTLVRPDAEGVALTLFGAKNTDQPFGLSFEFTDPNALTVFEGGIRGDIPPVLAPHLARILPPNIDVIEELEFSAPASFEPLVARGVDEGRDRDVAVVRRWALRGDGGTLSTRVIRPWRVAPSDESTEETLFEAAQRGPSIWMFSEVDKAMAKRLRGESEDAEAWVFELLLWQQANEPDEALKTLRKALKYVTTLELVNSLERLAPHSDFAAWELLWGVASEPERMAIVRALENRGERREAWRRASMLVGSASPRVGVEALVTVARVQGDRPAALVDEEAHRAWREPSLLLKKASKMASTHFGPQGHPLVDTPKAETMLLEGDCGSAAPFAKRALEAQSTPPVRAVHAEWRACSGDSTVAAELDDILADSNLSPATVGPVVRAWTKLGETGEARRWAFLGAVHADSDPDLWMTSMEASLAAGDLLTAIYSARRASDLEPESLRFSVPLQILATLGADVESAELATERSGYEVSIETPPISLDGAEAFITDAQRLGFLRLRDAEVLADPERLRERAERQRELGDEVGAMRDAAWLIKRHRKSSAVGTARTALQDGMWSTNLLSSLAPYVRDTSVRRLRMETALMAGGLDPASDTRYLRGQPSAELIRLARYSPTRFRQQVAWDGKGEPDVAVPAGFRYSRILSVLKGVVGYTNADAVTALVASTVPEQLPPPVAGVYHLGRSLGTHGKVEVFELEGGIAPAFAARRTVGEVTWWGISRSRQLARSAVDAAVVAQSIR